jgi:hypothetical protein
MSASRSAASRTFAASLWAILLTGGIGFLAACGETGSTDPASPPTQLIPLSPAVDTVVTGELTDPPISVRIEDALGAPVEGIPVRFVLVEGEGELFPNLAVSGQDGVAEAGFEASGTPGEVQIQVDIPSASNVQSLRFDVWAVAADSVALRLVEGNDQRAEVGSQLPIPFVVQALSSSGTPAGGIAIAWRITLGGDQSALLTADTTLTDATGRGRVLLTLGRQAREYRIEAFAARGVQSDTTVFTATATTDFVGTVRLDSASVTPLVAGEEAMLFGRGFSPIASENDVRIEGESAEILEATGALLRIVVPEFGAECLPAREVGVRVLVSEDPSNGEMMDLRPQQPPLDLAVGEVRAIRGPAEVACLQFSSSSTPREYRLAIGSTRRDPETSTTMRLVTRSGFERSSGGIATSLSRRELDAGVQEQIRTRLQPDARLRTRALEGLVRRRVAPVSLVPGPSATIPVVGDTVQYYFAAQPNLTVSCEDTSRVTRGIVRDVRQHVILVEDTGAPAGGFTADDWTLLADEVDRITIPTDTAYFGAPADIDRNGRVILLWTPEVNRLSPSGGGRIGGFFLPLDLAASGRGDSPSDGPSGEVCAASNEAEIIYLPTADPEAEAGEAVTREQALANARGMVAHELQHLINAERRVLAGDGGFGATEEVWLDEALSAIAEEIVGLRLVELGERGDHTFDQVTPTSEASQAFDSYQLNNFFNLSLFLSEPAAAPTLSNADPGGLEGRQMRGFGWLLLRWLGDQSGSDSRSLFRSVAAGGRNRDRGVANLELATGRAWEDLLADLSVAIAADDAGVDELDDRFRILTWQFRDVFAALSQSPTARSSFPVPFPLAATALGFETTALEFDVGASTVRYFALVSGLDSPALALSLLRPSGATFTEAARPQVTVVRTR